MFPFDSHLVTLVLLGTGKTKELHLGSESVSSFIGNPQRLQCTQNSWDVVPQFREAYSCPLAEICIGNHNFYPHISQESIRGLGGGRGWAFFPLTPFPKLLFKISIPKEEKPTSQKGGGGKHLGLRVTSSISYGTS